MRPAATAESLLTAFFDARRALPLRAAALDARVDCDLRLAVEVEGERLLDPDEAVLLHLERQLDPIGAAARVLGPVGLVRVLQRYLLGPLYRPDAPGDLRARTAVCGALVEVLAAEPALAGRARLLRGAREALRLAEGGVGAA